MNRLPPASPARRHFMGIVALCGKTIDDRSFIGFARSPPGQNADALGILPRGDPSRGGPNCSGAERLF